MNPPQLPPTPATPSAAASFIAVTAKLSLLMSAMAIVWSLLQVLLVLHLMFVANANIFAHGKGLNK